MLYIEPNEIYAIDTDHKGSTINWVVSCNKTQYDPDDLFLGSEIMQALKDMANRRQSLRYPPA